METVEPAGLEPPFWILVFNHRSSVWWVRWLAHGRYHHVKACAPVPELKAWVFYDVTLTETRISVAPLEQAQRIWVDFTAEADLIRMKRDPRGARFVRLGFWCVPAIKHLMGLRCGALRPDALWRHCVAHGGEIIRGQSIIPRAAAGAAIRPAAS